MAQGKFVSYLRVSTDRQGKPGLGLEAQRTAVRDYLNGGQWWLCSEHVEVEAGKRNDRPELAKALAACKAHGATLVIARLDRLARNVAFVSNLMEAGVEFVAVDFPTANRLTVHNMAAVAEHESKAISERIKAALARKKEWYAQLSAEEKAAMKGRGQATSMGGFKGKVPTEAQRKAGAATRTAKAKERANNLVPVIAELRANGHTTYEGLARAMTERGIPAARGRERWSAAQVRRLLARME